jgi:hypothetical protein
LIAFHKFTLGSFRESWPWSGLLPR